MSSELVTALTSEAQEFGESLIRMSEFARTSPLTATQLEILRSAPSELDALGLELTSDLDGQAFLVSSGVVGIVRLASAGRPLLVQVEPKVGGADVFRMLDVVFGVPENALGPDVELSTEKGWPAALFLSFFLSQVSSFLRSDSHRGYSIEEAVLQGHVKGRPLLRPYAERHLSRASPQTVPCQFNEFSANVPENQIILFALYKVAGLLDALDGDTKQRLHQRLRICQRLLSGVEPERFTGNEIESFRYSRLTAKFEPIHRLCRVIIEQSRLTFKPGERVPFTGFAISMAWLFERYVATLLGQAFPGIVESDKRELTFPVSELNAEIALDALVTGAHGSAVVECKYKDVSPAKASEERGWLESKVRTSDLYQSVAYAGHADVLAETVILAYPTWSSSSGPVELSEPSDSFGWRSTSKEGIRTYLLGINLSSNQLSLRDGLRYFLAPLPAFSASAASA